MKTRVSLRYFVNYCSISQLNECKVLYLSNLYGGISRTFPTFFFVFACRQLIMYGTQEWKFRTSLPEVFLGKDFLKICSKFTGEHPCRSAISIKLQITLPHGCTPVNLLHISRTPFLKNTSERLILLICLLFVFCFFLGQWLVV